MHYIMKVSRHRNQVEGDPLAKDKILWILRIISNGLKTHQFKRNQWLYLNVDTVSTIYTKLEKDLSCLFSVNSIAEKPSIKELSVHFRKISYVQKKLENPLFCNP